MHTPLVLSSSSLIRLPFICCMYCKCLPFYLFSGQLDNEHNSGLAVIIYLEHKAGIVSEALTWGLPNFILSCWILLFVYWSDQHKTLINDNILQVFAFVAAEYETSKNTLNQVWIYFALCGSCVLMPLMQDQDPLLTCHELDVFAGFSMGCYNTRERGSQLLDSNLKQVPFHRPGIYTKETYRTLTGAR